MIWSLFRWTWLLEAPLFVGTAPAGSLNRCRLYVPARAVWGAVTAELAQRQANGFPKYEAIGNALQEHVRFTYLYPAEPGGGRWRAWLPRYERGNGLVWRREDSPDESTTDVSDREFRIRLLAARPSTAIDPSSDTAAEGSLRETECVNARWREKDGTPGSPVALVGYVFVREGAPELHDVEVIAVGGDTRYGLGRLRRIQWEAASNVFAHATKLDGPEPAVESDCLLAHADARGDVSRKICGTSEALGGWDRGSSSVRRVAGPLWTPGSRLDSGQWWLLTVAGYWQASTPTRAASDEVQA